MDGTYRFVDDNTLEIVGPGGPGTWHRKKAYPFKGAHMDIRLYGLWILGGNTNGVHVHMSLDLGPSGGYNEFSNFSEESTLSASNGQFSVHTTLGKAESGTYGFFPDGSLKMVYPRGPFVWSACTTDQAALILRQQE